MFRVPYTVELHLSGRWLSESAWPFDKFVGNSTKLTCLEITVIGSSTVQSYGFQNFKLGVVEWFRRIYIL